MPDVILIIDEGRPEKDTIFIQGYNTYIKKALWPMVNDTPFLKAIFSE